MAMELFELKAKYDEQEKDLQLSRTEAEARERDFKVHGTWLVVGIAFEDRINRFPPFALEVWLIMYALLLSLSH